MKTFKTLFIILVMAALALQACNLPEGVDPNAPDLNLTVTANAAMILTAQAQGLQPLAEAAQPGSVDPAPAGIDAPPPTEAAGGPSANAATPTVTLSGAPIVTVSIATNCRTGPGQAYGISYGLPVGQTAEVVGKNTSTNYWIIKIPNGNGTCWLWGQYATVTGDASTLPTVAIPPTPTPTVTATPTITATLALPPAAPSNPSAVLLTCTTSNFVQTFTAAFTWTDNSNNETGFNIYVNANFADGSSKDLLNVSVGPNTTNYTVTGTSLSKSPPLIKVEAFNNAGSSTRVSASALDLSSCP